MKVLMYDNRKIDPLIWDASTPEAEEAALNLLFRYLDEEWQVYTGMNKSHKPLYDKAKAGDSVAVKKLLSARKDYEYEDWSFYDVIDPFIKPDDDE